MKDDNRYSAGALALAFAARSRVDAYLRKVCSSDTSLPPDLRNMAQKLIAEENHAKLDLVFDADDPAGACYSDMIREIFMEAQGGVFLVRPDASSEHLRTLVGEPGVSGKLHAEMAVIAPLMFADQAAHSASDFDIVWVTVEARHDRAHIDATVSQIIMSHILDDEDEAREMARAIRAVQYALHEDGVRRRCGLPRILDDQAASNLRTMAVELVERCSNFEERAREIRERVEAEAPRKRMPPLPDI